jgi:hypothetical protein
MHKKVEENKKEQPEKPVQKPNEQVGFYFSSSIKITDPNTKEVLVHMRGDN